MAKYNSEQNSDSSENEGSYTSGGKRKEKRLGNVDKVPRKSTIRKKPDNPAKDKPPKPGGVDKKRLGSQEKKPLVD